MPPRPSSPMMRYRSASTIPGVNPPTGIESEEIRRPTGEATMGVPVAATGIGGDSTVPVGIWESEPIGVPHFRQKLLSSGTSLEHDGQFISSPFVSITDQHQVLI